jgi:hypothetical protein
MEQEKEKLELLCVVHPTRSSGTDEWQDREFRGEFLKWEANAFCG